jgi:biotin carboxyl carrier protein
MKMQNEMKAVRVGNVVEVRVSNGDTVSAGDVLVVLG